MSSSDMVTPLSAEELTPALAEQLRPRMERLGYLGGFFTHAAHQPEALLAFVQFTEALKHAVAPAHTEVVALTLATLLGNDYERHQHEQLCLKQGHSRAWVRAVEGLAPEDHAGELTADECAVQSLALAVARSEGRRADAEFRQSVEMFGEQVAVGILLLIGRYVAHGFVSNTFGLLPPVPSIFENEATDDA